MHRQYFHDLAQRFFKTLPFPHNLGGLVNTGKFPSAVLSSQKSAAQVLPVLFVLHLPERFLTKLRNFGRAVPQIYYNVKCYTLQLFED